VIKIVVPLTDLTVPTRCGVRAGGVPVGDQPLAQVGVQPVAQDHVDDDAQRDQDREQQSVVAAHFRLERPAQATSSERLESPIQKPSMI
jgi:hypothetical protein